MQKQEQNMEKKTKRNICKVHVFVAKMMKRRI